MKHAATANHLLASLPAKSRASLLASCEMVELEFAEVLCESGDPIRHVYFPTSSFVSLITRLDSGEKLEVGIVGAEGMYGMSLVLGIKFASHHALVQGAGMALRMTRPAFVRHLEKNAAFNAQMHRYIYVLMRQLALTAACSHYHDIVERLARWLLLTRDRAHSGKFHLTHEFLSYMLGVRRVGITEAATELHKRGLIEYQRGEIVILNDAGLEKAACCCYQQANNLYHATMVSKSKPPHLSQ